MDRTPSSEPPEDDAEPVNRIAPFLNKLEPSQPPVPLGIELAALVSELQNTPLPTPELRVAYEEELKTLSAAYEADPSSTTTLKGMIRVLYQLGEYARLLPYAAYFRSLAPEPDPLVEALLASARLKLGYVPGEGES